MWCVSNDESKEIDGEQSGPGCGTEGQWLVSLADRCGGGLVRDCGVVVVGTRLRLSIEEVWRYEARVEEACVSRSFRRYESRVETGDGAAWRRRRRWSLRIVMPEQYCGQ